jgi:hypothetical protein
MTTTVAIRADDLPLVVHRRSRPLRARRPRNRRGDRDRPVSMLSVRASLISRAPVRGGDLDPTNGSRRTASPAQPRDGAGLSPQLAHALGEGVYRLVQEREEVALTAVPLPEVERDGDGPEQC